MRNNVRNSNMTIKLFTKSLSESVCSLMYFSIVCLYYFIVLNHTHNGIQYCIR